MASISKPGAPVTDNGSAWKYLFRYLWPFWMFVDANSGTPSERTLAYRHNRERRVYLPGYILKWLCISFLFFCLTSLFGALEIDFPEFRLVYVALLAATGTAFTGSLIVTLLICAAYLLLCRNEE